MAYRQMVTNEEGEPLGFDYIYDDEPDQDDFYERDYRDYDDDDYSEESSDDDDDDSE